MSSIVPADPGQLRAVRRVSFTHVQVAEFAAVDARRISSDWHDWRVQSKSLGRCKVSNSYPGRVTSAQSGHLAEVVNEARQARGERKQLRAPTPPPRAGQRPLFARMNWHLRRVARRALDEWFVHGHDAPAVDDLAAALAAYVWTEHGDLIHYREPGAEPLGRRGPRWLAGDDAVRRVAMSAASYALRKWNPLRVMKHRLASAAGGMKSRRGPSKATAERFAALAKLMADEPRLTRQQQAERLGVSLSTIYGMHRTLRAES